MDQKRFAVVASLSMVLSGQCALAAPTAPPTRLAVVIANAKYREVGELKNPAQDGQLVQSALKAAGFDVQYHNDLDDPGFRAALRQLARDSSRYDVTLVYYAGHGVQVGGVNFLVPVDLKPPEQDDDIRLASISADDVLSVIKSSYRILVLDACRDNPVISRSLRKGRGIGYKRGLAPVSPASEGEGGIFIAYSTQSDAVALDGEGKYSPFAEAFANHVGASASIDDMFALVTHDVLQATKGAQRPFKYASIDRVFCLAGACAGTESKADTPAVSPVAPAGVDTVVAKMAELSAATDAAKRARLERGLTSQLYAALPRTVVYGYADEKDRGKIAMAFEPASVQAVDGRLSVTVHQLKLGDDRILTDSGWSAEELLDCKHQRYTYRVVHSGGNIKYFTDAEQKSKEHAIEAHTVIANLERALCSTPLRFLPPLWAVNDVNWTQLSRNFEAVLALRYQDPLERDRRYLFYHDQLKGPTVFGAEEEYGWLGINCSSHEVSYLRFGGKKGGPIVSVDAGAWEPISEHAAAGNAYAILCSGH
jgi:uncharacterized caspase-like protein